MRFVRSILVRLVALGLLVLGSNGLERSQLTRSYVQVVTITFQTASATDVEGIFDEAKRSFGDAAISRMESTGVNRLGVEISGRSWQDANEESSRFQNAVSKAATARNLSITNTGSSGGGRISRDSRNERYRFLVYVGVTMLGAAMLILSLRIFGGGRPPEYQIPDTRSA